MSKTKSSNFKSGYTKYDHKKTGTVLANNNHSSDEKSFKSKNKYPKGYLTFFFITCFTIIVFLFSLLYSKFSWTYSLSIGLGVGWFCNLFWLYSRLTIGSRVNYMGKQMLDVITFKPIREKKNWVVKSWARNEVKNFNEYQFYCQKKKENSSFVFYISLISYTILFVISVILSVVVK